MLRLTSKLRHPNQMARDDAGIPRDVHHILSTGGSLCSGLN